MKRLSFVLAAILTFSVVSAQPVRDTVLMSYPEDCTMKVNLRHDYAKTFVAKIFLSGSKYDGRYKYRDNGKQEVRLNFEQALERIRGLDNITLGMPKIAYLVGWQYNGHDSKYPALFEGNERLRRPCDDNALQSIRWLCAEGKKYNTSVSFHINMFDCFEDSPSFMEYVNGDALARTRMGNLRPSEWGYKVDYVQEWKSGLAQKRIDRMCELLPVQDAGTIHIDAFHTSVPYPVEKPDGTWSVAFDTLISPYHGWSMREEVAAQIEIIKYWDGKGVDVTTEGLDYGVDGLNDPHAGYRAMVYHIIPELHTRYPESMLTGGDCGSYIGKRIFGSNDELESVLQKTPCDWSEAIKRLCTSTFIFNYVNRHERKMYIKGPDYGRVEFTDGVVTEVDGKHYTVSENGVLMVENDDVFVPAMWMKGCNIVAYSASGYKNRTWTLLPSCPAKGKVSIYSVDEKGRHLLRSTSYKGGKIRLSVNPGQMLLLTLK